MTRRSRLLVMLAALSPAFGSAAQEDWASLLDESPAAQAKWSGVFEGNATAFNAPLESSVGSNWFARAEYQYQQDESLWVVHSQLDYDYFNKRWALSALEERNVPDRFIDLETQDNGDKQRWSAQIDWAYWQHDWQQGRLTVGRQPVTVGLGRLFSPLDPLGAFAVFDLDRLYKRGVDALRFDYFATEDLLSQTVITGNQNDQLNVLQVIKGTLEQGTWLVTAAFREEQRFVSISGQQHVEWLNADVYSEVLTAQLRGDERELAGRNEQQRYLLGLSTKVGRNGLFTMEWLQQSLAASHEADYLFWQNYQATSQITSIGLAKRYVAVSYSDEWRDLTRYELLAMQNLVDNHATLSLVITHSASDNMQLRLAAAWTPTQGHRDSEFEQFADVLQLGFRYYF